MEYNLEPFSFVRYLFRCTCGLYMHTPHASAATVVTKFWTCERHVHSVLQ